MKNIKRKNINQYAQILSNGKADNCDEEANLGAINIEKDNKGDIHMGIVSL